MSALDWLRNTFGPGRRAADVANAYRFVFALPEGRQVLADLAAYSSQNAVSIHLDATGRADTGRVMFDLGARDMYLHMVECAGLKPADVARELQGDTPDE